MEKGLIVFLNGTSSAGKTSISKSIIELSDKPFMHLSIDEFSMGIFQSYLGWMYSQNPKLEDISEEQKQVCGDILTKPLVSLFHTTIKSLSEIGTNVIVDHVAGANREWLSECVQLLEANPVMFVGVRCSLEELERREKARGDRHIGLAKSQFESMHANGSYDIEVNSDQLSAQECAKLIVNEIEKGTAFKAFQSLHL